MNYQYARDLPGSGDCLRPVEIDHDAAIKAIADAMYESHMASLQWTNDIQGFMTDAEATAIATELTVDVAQEDDAELGRMLRAAVKRATREYVDGEARMRYLGGRVAA